MDGKLIFRITIISAKTRVGNFSNNVLRKIPFL